MYEREAAIVRALVGAAESEHLVGVGEFGPITPRQWFRVAERLAYRARLYRSAKVIADRVTGYIVAVDYKPIQNLGTALDGDDWSGTPDEAIMRGMEAVIALRELGDSSKGKEAEELRAGLEALINESVHGVITGEKVQALLDRVDARDVIAKDPS